VPVQSPSLAPTPEAGVIGKFNLVPWWAIMRPRKLPLTQENAAMAVALFMVRATITKDKDAAFNRWYNEEHVPQVLQFNGAVSARRYRKILGEDKFEYMALYEFASEEVFRRFLDSDHLKTLVKDYDANFGGVSDRQRAGYVQIFP
jgi:hypothetical protein